MEVTIDYYRLREDLINDLGLAKNYNEMAEADLVYVESCSDEELESYAIRNSIDLEKYQKYVSKL